MTELFIDIGNSRIKFALADSQHLEFLGAFSIAELNTVDLLVDLLEDFDIQPDRIFIVSVGSAQFEHDLREAIAIVWREHPVFLSTQVACCGLQNGYTQPLQLGVDRWMAMLGARSFTHKDFIVIDAGTAITVDAVVEDKHLGGFIFPGLSTMRQSLTSGTAKLSADCSQSLMAEQSAFLATNTADAICGGSLYMAAATLNNLLFDLQAELGATFKIYLTGGDAKLIAPLLNSKVELVTDLVLQGMRQVTESLKK
ncbi:type III pantothenate kinase [Thiomicrorhabdus cannonii]|uniref:type III pantothenate kinase n=1 Tax=Thiomicrorhabdus cannonii TaxID=2748011 RepID=UPI0015BCDD9F|nr:type III pantothenate kinase [Thiomicrorhabdus cannonii]